MLVESTDAEPWIGRANNKIRLRFSSAWRVGTPDPQIVQGSTMFRNEGAM